MILGLDVGGTQTDAVLIDGDRIVVATKTPSGDDLLDTLRSSIIRTLADVDPDRIRRMAFSTTLATNTIVQDRLEDAGMIVSAGPGMDPEWFSLGPSYHVVEGCLDHQGLEVKPVDIASVIEAASEIRAANIRVAGVVSKFSVRNPLHELQIKEQVADLFSHTALGHQASGALNFPRRITTTYLNAALYTVHHQFSSALVQILNERGLFSPRYLLKPDGGTVDLDKSIGSPAHTAQSGPAASVMGALALDGCEGTTLVLDIGGTTTDMSIVLDGIPLLNPHGIRLGPFQTLIRSLLTHSLGAGGDSEVRGGKGGVLRVGPLRRGRPVAFGGPAPTPTDAMITLGLLKAGNIDLARQTMEQLGSTLGWDAITTAERVLQALAETIADSANAFLHEINSQPVYTIHEVLKDQRIVPTSLLIIGGPAPYMTEYLAGAFGLPHRVPDHFGVANAVGAAVARVTTAITLQADTERGSVIIPEAGIQNRIDPGFDMKEAIALGTKVLRQQSLQVGAGQDRPEVSITERQEFNMIRGFSRMGRNIRLEMCITPGLVPEWKRRG